MRKWIIAAVVAVALFSIGAFAASFSLTANNVSSGAAPVTSCNTTANIAWQVNVPADSFTPTSTANYTVTGATITTASGCTNQHYELAIQGAGTFEVHCSGALSGGSSGLITLSSCATTGTGSLPLKVSDTAGAALFIGDSPVTITTS